MPTQLVPIYQKGYDGMIKAKIVIEIEIPIGSNDIRKELSRREALGLVKMELDYLSGCNDGSELLANIQDEQIDFPI